MHKICGAVKSKWWKQWCSMMVATIGRPMLILTNWAQICKRRHEVRVCILITDHSFLQDYLLILKTSHGLKVQQATGTCRTQNGVRNTATATATAKRRRLIHILLFVHSRAKKPPGDDTVGTFKMIIPSFEMIILFAATTPEDIVLPPHQRCMTYFK